MMKTRWSALGVFVAWAWMSALPAAAQTNVATARWMPEPGETQTRSPANISGRVVSLDIRGATLSEVLGEIQRQSGIAVAGGEDVLAESKRVTVKFARLSAWDAVTQVLRGTSLSASVSSAGAIVVAKRTGTVMAQGVIVGKVIHAKTKQPIAGATFMLDDATLSITSGADGTFRIPASVGTHRLEVRAVGLTRHAQRVTVVEGVLTVEVIMEPTASVLDEVVVTGTIIAAERKTIPNPITVITAEDIEKRGITRIDQFFRGEVPGVISIEEGTRAYQSGISPGLASVKLGGLETSQIYARGSSNVGVSGTTNTLKTFVDGVELLNSAYLGTLDMQSVERIEIITGPQAATLYGSGAMGGVMQIFTKRGLGRREEVSINMRYGTIENNLSSGLAPTHTQTIGLTGSAGGTMSYNGTVSHQYNGQWQPGLFSRMVSGSVGVNDVRSRLTIGGSVNLSAGRNGTLRFAGDAYAQSPIYQRNAALGIWIGNPNAIAPTSEIALSSSQTFSFNATYRVTPAWQHTATAGRNATRFEIHPTAPGFLSPGDSLYRTASSSGQRVTVGYNTSLITPPSRAVSSAFTLGINGSIGTQDQMYGCMVSEIANTFIACGGSQNVVTVRRIMNSQSWGGFGTWRLSLLNQLHLTLGVRGERNPAYGRDHKIDWTPNNGFAYNMELGDVTFKFQGSYGRATREPTPEMRLEVTSCFTDTDPACYTSQAENLLLRPERSSGPQGGMEIYIGNRGSLTVNHYSQTVRDLIQTIVKDSGSLDIVGYNGAVRRGANTNQYINAAKVRQFGWEGTGSLNLWLLNLKGTYSWSDSRILALSPQAVYAGGSLVTQQMYVGRSFRNVPTHTGYLSVGYAHGPTAVTWSTSFVGASIVASANNSLALSPEAIYARINTYIDKRAQASLEYRKSGYAKTDVAIIQRLAPWLSATANLNNVFNGQGSEVGPHFPVQGRRTMFGLAMRHPFAR